MACSIPLPTAYVLAALILASACVSTPIGDDPIDASTTTMGPAPTETDDQATLGATSTPPTDGDTTADPTTATAASTDTGVTGPCPDVPGFECSVPSDCGIFTCGDVLRPFDAEGCLRHPCGAPQDCDDGQLCFFPNEEYGVCTSSSTTCSDGPTGECECVSDPDCGGGYCMTDCFALSDETRCAASGCGLMTVVEISETCACAPDTPVCFDSPAGIGGVPSYLWHVETLRVAYFGSRQWQIPIGWRPCSDFGAPPACSCNDLDSEPACTG